MKYYITKYALTQGVHFLECETSDDGYAINRKGYYSLYRIGTDAFETREAAEARVQELIEAKRKSLQKAIDRLDKQVVFHD